MKFYPVFKPNPPKYAMVEADNLEEASKKIRDVLYTGQWFHHFNLWVAAGGQVCAITKENEGGAD